MKNNTLIKILAAPVVLTGAALAITGGRRGNSAWEKLRGWRYAHRGFHEKPSVPENSLPAFKRAIERGFGAELDVHLLKDGTLAVFHDSDLMRCAGVEGVLEELTLDELRELRLEGTEYGVPLFDEVLELFEGKTPLIIELKSYKDNRRALARAVCERLDSYKGDYCIESFDPLIMLAVRRLRPGICRGQLAADFFRAGSEIEMPLYQRIILSNLLHNFLSRPDFVAYKFEDRRNLINRLCVRRGVQEVCWTIRSREDLLTTEKDGAIAIFECFDPEE